MNDFQIGIDLNCDVGEGAGFDAAVLPLVTSANIACGGHAGDPMTMAATVEMARAAGAAVGAHPGLEDRSGFGRRERPLVSMDLASLVLGQISALADIAGDSLSHVKLHGALYHQVARDTVLADAVATVLAGRWPWLAWMLPSGCVALDVCRAHGLRVIEEAFLDRGYAEDGTLLQRSHPAGLIADPHIAAARAVRIVREGRVTSATGTDLGLHADTLCVHGDGPDPVGCLLEIRRAFADAGIAIRRW